MCARDRLLIPRSLVGLIAAPAVVRAESLMPIVMGKPTFGSISGGGGAWAGRPTRCSIVQKEIQCC
jgi:hypothetical protein